MVVVALAALTALVSARQSAPAPAALDAEAVSSSAAALPPAIESDLPAAAANLDSLPIKMVPDAQEAVQRRMIDEFGASCLRLGEADVYYPPDAARKLDEKITTARVSGEGWVVDGELWLGSPDRAAKAFGASTVYADEHSVWMFIVTDNVPRAREPHRSQSESGKVTWEPLDQTSPSSCPSDSN